jgi:hypothetical protein
LNPHRRATGTLFCFGGFAAALGVAISCKSNSINNTNNGTNDYVTQKIDAKGGEIDGPNGIRVVFAAGAVQTPTEFSIGTVGEFPTPPGIAASNVYSLKPHGFLFGGQVTVSLPLANGETTGELYHASCDQNDVCQKWDGTPVSGVTFANASGGAVANFNVPSFSIYMVVQGGTGPGNDASTPDATVDAAGDGGIAMDDSGTSCNPKSVSAAACFTSNDITCNGIGTADCSCTTNYPGVCAGTGGPMCEFTWHCYTNATDAGPTGQGCGWSTVGGGAGTSSGGSGGNCATTCASTNSAANAMASALSCGSFTSP